MAVFTLKLGLLNIEPDVFYRHISQNVLDKICEAFSKATASEYSGLEPTIQIHVDNSVTDFTVPGEIGQKVTSSELTPHLRTLVGYQDGRDAPVENIGLIFTSEDPKRELLGNMFDVGNGNLPAREGAAIYMDEIIFRRPVEQIEDQIIFTAVHELGHVFNLKHNDVSASFLRRSHERSVYRQSFFRFTHSQKIHLNQCDTNSDVWPGGSVWTD